MHHLMVKSWWILVARGVLGMLLGMTAVVWIIHLETPAPDIFGMALFFRPIVMGATLLFLMGIYAFLDGLFALLLGFQNYGEGRHWWSLVLEGSLSIGLGILAWLDPKMGAPVLFYWIAAWAFFTGLLEIFQGVELNEYRDRRKPFLMAGFISIFFSFLVLGFHLGGEMLIWMIAGYAFFFGFPLLTLGFHLRRYVKWVPKGA